MPQRFAFQLNIKHTTNTKHTNTLVTPNNSLNTQPRGLGWRIHYGVEVTELRTNKHKQHFLSDLKSRDAHAATLFFLSRINTT
jgi:hypothetical protein